MFFSLEQKIKELHESPWKMVLALTGGGSGALPLLLGVAGASGTILEGIVPYSNASILDFLKKTPEHYSSELTARQLAMASFQRALHLDPVTNTKNLLGIGATSSLASDRPKRGDHRIHIAIQSLQETWSFSLTFIKGERTRAEEEEISSLLIIFSLFHFLEKSGKNNGQQDYPDLSCSTDQIHTGADLWKSLLFDHFLPGERILVRRCVASSEWGDLLFHPLGPVRAITWTNNNFKIYQDDARNHYKNIFPGSFHPIHHGHLKIMEMAEQETGTIPILELSVQNVDKPSLDYLEIADRLCEIQKVKSDIEVVFTQAPRFIDKSNLFPGSQFIMGADTLLRIADLSYYGGESEKYGEILHHFMANRTKFIVFARIIEDRLETVSNLPIDETLRQLCQEIPPSRFLEDISSTILRKNHEKIEEK